MPTPEEKQDAKPVKRRPEEGISKIDLQEKADEVMEKLETAAAAKTDKDVKKAQTPVKTPAKAAKKVQKSAKSASETEQQKRSWRRPPKCWPLSEGDRRKLF